MARKSRKNPAVQEKTAHAEMKVWKAALYIRLSVEFNGRRGDSLETQQQIMEAYLALCPDIEITAVYTDNGTTGRTFEREAFQQMLDDVERGKINCIVVKDLSRLGRNAIDSGYYIEKYFPLHQVRFIAVNDQYDSENKENSGNHLIVPLKNMINEAYAADISKKVKAQQRQAMQDGAFVGSRPPYGYKKAPDNCHKLLVNEDTAPVVRQIFQWTTDGISLNDVVKRLNGNGYPSPGHYLMQTGVITNKRLAGSGKWQTWTVSKILADEVYTGDMVQGKTKTVGHRQIPTDRSEWIIVRGTHEPLITRELFDKAQAVRENAAAKYSQMEKVPYTENILRGRIFCGRCGKNLHRQRSRGIYSYRCIANDRMGIKYCAGGITYLSEAQLFDAILTITRKHAEVVIGTHLRTAKYVKFRRGEYQSVLCPYGYQKSANGRMEPDEETAPNVRLIFELAARGCTSTEIIRKLYARHIPTPGEYKASKGREIHDISRTHQIWQRSTIRNILHDERYTGTYIMGRHQVVEVGSTRVRSRDESEWIKIPDHHPAIISKEQFRRVQELKPRKICIKKNVHLYPLRGKVFCGCCGHAMPRAATKNHAFACKHTEVNPAAACHGLRITEKDLETLLFEIISKQAQVILNVENLANASLLDMKTQQQAEYGKRVESCLDQKRLLYEQVLLKEISMEEYKARKAAVDTELDRLRQVHNALTTEISQAKMDAKTKSARLELAQEITTADSLTDSLADMLIERVNIYPGNQVDIVWKMKDFCME